MVLAENNIKLIRSYTDMPKHLSVNVCSNVIKDKETDIEEFKQNMIVYTHKQENNLRKSIDKLENILKSFAQGSIMQYREYNISYLNRMIKDGHLLYGDEAMIIAGPSGQCHRNSSELWKANHKKCNVHIETGYALSADGMWYQHSWLVLFNEEGQLEVVEATPLRRLAYYGFQLKHAEAVRFHKSQIK